MCHIGLLRGLVILTGKLTNKTNQPYTINPPPKQLYTMWNCCKQNVLNKPCNITVSACGIISRTVDQGNTGEIAIVTNAMSSFSLCKGPERLEEHLMLYKTAE